MPSHPSLPYVAGFFIIHALLVLGGGSFDDATGFVIDTFQDINFNDLGAWHGPGEGMPVMYSNGSITFSPTDADQNFHTQLSPGCFDLEDYASMYLHVSFSGTRKFSISLNQHNQECDWERSPYPETWDTVEAARYTSGNHIYVPLSHFAIDLSKVISVSFHGFYTRRKVTLHTIEIVAEAPENYRVPRKLPSGKLVLRCKRPNSFAFGIDDGEPEFAPRVMEILNEEEILVTFFVVARGLENPSTNFTNVYQEMLSRGHQVALHSYTHPRMEGLRTVWQIDREITRSMKVLKEKLGIESRYFRPPFGVLGARTRQRIARFLDDPYIVDWSVDIADWLYANTSKPEKQLESFRRDVRRGGDLVVMHYLSPTTVRYFREAIQIAKATGKQIMRVDQCMQDPDAPPLPVTREEIVEEEDGSDDGPDDSDEPDDSDKIEEEDED